MAGFPHPAPHWGEIMKTGSLKAKAVTSHSASRMTTTGSRRVMSLSWHWSSLKSSMFVCLFSYFFPSEKPYSLPYLPWLPAMVPYRSNNNNQRIHGGRYIYGGFHKWGYPQIIHFNWIFPYKPSSYWGTPIYGNLHIYASMNFDDVWFWELQDFATSMATGIWRKKGNGTGLYECWGFNEWMNGWNVHPWLTSA